MTNRIAEVSTEASATGQQATEVRQNAKGLDRAMEELRHSVIRVVRNSTAEVDRRAGVREAVDLSCKLIVGGETYDGRVVDLSEAGAKLLGIPPLQPDLRGTVAIAGLGSEVAIITRHAEDDGLGIEFAIGAANRPKFVESVGRLTRRRAA